MIPEGADAPIAASTAMACVTIESSADPPVIDFAFFPIAQKCVSRTVQGATASLMPQTEHSLANRNGKNSFDQNGNRYKTPRYFNSGYTLAITIGNLPKKKTRRHHRRHKHDSKLSHCRAGGAGLRECAIQYLSGTEGV